MDEKEALKPSKQCGFFFSSSRKRLEELNLDYKIAAEQLNNKVYLS